MSTNFTRLIGLLLLLGIFAAAVLLLMPNAAPTPNVETVTPIPNAPRQAYPPPGEGTPLPTATVAAYPAPNGEMVTRTPFPTAAPTATPWRVSDLPPLPTYAPPGPFQGMRVLYGDFQAGGFFIIDIQNRSILNLPAPLSNALVSPNGNLILQSFSYEFRIEREKWYKQGIWLREITAENAQLLVGSTETWVPSNGIWSPDGNQIAYLREVYSTRYSDVTDINQFQLDHVELWTVDIAEQNSRMITNAYEFMPQRMGTTALFFKWMLNGYIYYVDINNDLYAINPETANKYLLAKNVRLSDVIQIAPDGLQIASSDESTYEKLSGFNIIALNGKDVFWNDTGGGVAYVRDDALWLYSISNGIESKLTAIQPGINIKLHGLSPNNHFLAYTTQSGFYVIDVTKTPYEPILLLPNQESENNHSNFVFIDWVPVR